jgi:hypothetical protein
MQASLKLSRMFTRNEQLPFSTPWIGGIADVTLSMELSIYMYRKDTLAVAGTSHMAAAAGPADWLVSSLAPHARWLAGWLSPAVPWLEEVRRL